MRKDIEYEVVPVYGMTTEPHDYSKQSLLLHYKPTSNARPSRRRLCVVAAVAVTSVLLVAALLSSYFLLTHSNTKQRETMPAISYKGANSDGELLEEKVEVDVSSHTIVHFASGHKPVTSLYLYEKKLMIVKDSQCYVTEYTNNYEKDLSTISTYQNLQGNAVQHRRVLYKLKETMKREELIKLGGAAAGAFCPEKLVWRIETLNVSVAEYQQATREKTSLPSTTEQPYQVSTVQDELLPTTEQPYQVSTMQDDLIPSSTRFSSTDLYPSSTEEDELFKSSGLGADEEGSGEEDLSDFEYLDSIPYTIDDFEYRRKRQSTQCEGLATLNDELYPVECL